MRFLIDKNLLSQEFKTNAAQRDDICVLQDVLDEGGLTDQEVAKISKAGVRVIKVGRKHLEKLKEVLAVHGANFKLLDLYTGKGTADVMMVAFVLAEREMPGSLFIEEYTIVTNDKELTSVAKSYNIKCATDLK